MIKEEINFYLIKTIIFKIATAVFLTGSKFNIYMKLSPKLGFGRDRLF